MDLFTLVARLGMDSSEYERGIAKARGSFSELGNQIGAKAVAIGNMVSRAVEKAVDIAADLGKSAIQNAADVTAEKAQFQATFAELQGSAEKAFAEIEKSTGVFGTRLQNVGTKAFSQFKGAGLDGVDALSMMQEYTNLAADAAAYYDISLEDADARLRSFLRGNTEAGDAIGLFTSESQRNSAAMEKYGQKWQNLNEAQKQMLMLDISKDIYKQSGAIGQAARESDAWTNVIGNLKEAWRQATGVLGKPIMAVLTPVLKNVSEWLNDPETQMKIDQFGLGIADAINWILNPKLPTWEEVQAGSQVAIDAIKAGLDKALVWTLGKFDLSPANAEEMARQAVARVGEWWLGSGDNAYERIKSVLTWSFGKWVAPAASEYSEDVQNWWDDTFMPNLTGIAQWTFGQLIAPAWVDLYTGVWNWWQNTIKPNLKRVTTWNVGKAQWPSLGEMVASAKAWWNSVKSTISSIFTVVISPTYRSTTSAFTQDQIDAAMDQYSDQVDAITGATSHATGLRYVPYNDYYARLHEGEAVLTKAEASTWRKEGGAQAPVFDYAALADAVAGALDGAHVDMDGERVGRLVTKTVSREMAAEMRGRRYSFG